MNDDAQHNLSPDEPTPQQRLGMRSAIIGQCFGEIGFQLLEAGIVFLYLRGLGLSAARILFYLSFPWIFSAVMVLPAAFLGDRFGKKRVGFTGLLISMLGFTTLTLAGFADASFVSGVCALGIALYGIGTAMMESTWFALLSPVVPEPMRGRFFGLLRVSWRTVGVLFYAGCSLVLSTDAPTSTYQAVLGVVTASMLVRLWFYSRIPELETAPPPTHNVRTVVMSILRTAGFSSFGAYVFLLHLAVVGAPVVFNLIEKDVEAFGDNQVAWMGMMTMIGSMPGFWFGGKLVDRYTTKPVFLICHFGYGAVYALFLLRHLMPLPMPVTLGALHMVFGLIIGASSVAISTETLALIPPDNKSVSTSMIRLLNRIGGALSGAVAAWMIDAGMLADHWRLFGLEMSQYDTILLLWALMVVVLVVTLGLVPSVIGKAQWLPRSG